MNDLEKLKATLKEIGCDFDEETTKELYNEDFDTEYYNGQATWDVRIVIDNGIGYNYFYTEFYFFKGKYQGHGVWE